MKYIEACETGSWHLHLWPADQDHEDAEQCQRIPFSCRSWRHEGECRQWKGALDWWRVREGLKKRHDWVYIVLTFHQGDDYQRWRTYQKAGKSWDVLRKRFVRSYGKISYIQTWERHLKGGCHVNLLISNGIIRQDVDTDWKTWRNSFLKPNAVKSGFGPICWVEALDEKYNAVAGYLTKLANELTGADGKSQVPADAPPHFRRLRASRGILPPKPIPEMQGQLVKLPIPEYNSEIPEKMQPCGCVGKLSAKQERGKHETDKGVMASTS